MDPPIDQDYPIQTLCSQSGPSLVEPPSLHTAMTQDGPAWSAYATRRRLNIERRAIPGET